MDYVSNQEVFEKLEELGVDLTDRMVLAYVVECDGIILSDKKLSSPVTDFSFFQKNQYMFHMIQDGEYLSLKNIDPRRSFIAYRRQTDVSGEQELLIYRPESI